MEIEIFSSRSAWFYNILVSLKLFQWAYGLAYRRISKLAPPGSRVLEIGPGVGELLKILDKGGYAAVGLDISPPMLKYAQRRAPGVSVAGASFKAPLRDGAFDAAVALFTLHHWGDHEPSVHEIWRLLKPGGYFIAVEVDLHRMHLVGSHGCTEECMKRVLGMKFAVTIERPFPLLVAVARKTQ
ncbi:MAG: class I SAM-dependent methyltransferase [Pyrobaculum sp.]